MSLDSVDDQEYAEEVCGQLAKALRTVLAEARPCLVGNPLERALAGVAAFEDYCRPSCGYLDDGECASGEDMCGCLCQHDDTAAIGAPDHPPLTASPR